MITSFVKVFEDYSTNPFLFKTTEIFKIKSKKSKDDRTALIAMSYIGFMLPLFGFSALHLVFK